MRTLNKEQLDYIMEYTINRFGFNNWWYHYLVKYVMKYGDNQNDLKQDLDDMVERARDKTDYIEEEE
jgi:hypothetical protein